MEVFWFILAAVWFVLPIVALLVALRQHRISKDIRQRLERLERAAGLGASPYALPVRGGVAPAEPPPPPPTRDAPLGEAAPNAAESAPPPPAAVAPPPAPRRPSLRSRFDGVDAEELLGGKVLNRAGALALAIALAFFLKHAFEADWLGPWGRVFLGLGVGLALTVAGAVLMARGQSMFGQGVTGAGLAIQYATLYVAHDIFGVMPQLGAFAALVGVSVEGLILALWQRTQVVALLAIIGGYLIPLLVGVEADPLPLGLYLIALDAMALGLSAIRGWRALDGVALLGTHLVWIGWTEEHYTRSLFPQAYAIQIGLLLLFLAAPPIRRWSRRTILQIDDLILWAGAGAAFLIWSLWMFQNDNREGLGWIAVNLALLYLLLATLVRRRAGEQAFSYRAPLIMALAYLTIAVPLELDRMAVTLCWVAQGTLLLWLSDRSRSPWVRIMAVITLGIAIVHFLFVDLDDSSRSGMMLLNTEFLLQLLVVAGIALAAEIARRQGATLFGLRLDRPLGIAAGVLGWVTLLQDVWLHARIPVEMPPDSDLPGPYLTRRAPWAHAAVSIAWAIYAGVAVLMGFVRGSKTARWFGLVLFLILIVKVITVDLADLPTFHRFVSFLVAGVVLMAVSWLYMRKRPV